MLRKMLLGFGCLIILAQPVKDPMVAAHFDENRKGVSFTIEEVLLPPRDDAHDFYPVLRVKRGGTQIAEVTPEMLSEVMTDNDALLPCESLPDAEKRQCFGKGILGSIHYFSICDAGTEVEVYVELGYGENRDFLSFTVDLDAPHPVLRGWTMNGTSVSKGIPSPWDDDKNPNPEEWCFYVCTLTSRGSNPILLAVVRPAFATPEGGDVIYLGVTDVGAPSGTTRLDFVNLKWEGFKELAFDAMFYGTSGAAVETEIGRVHKVYDVVAQKFIQSPAQLIIKKTTRVKPEFARPIGVEAIQKLKRRKGDQ